MTKRLLALCLVLVMLVSVVPFPAQAAYENTHTNTGNQRYDIIQVALTQVGYQEGSNNYTKYGEYFGWPNTAWCGWFVSWCAAQANVPRSVLKRQGIAKASNFGLSTFTASEKLPQSGDLYFKSGHVGLVYKVEGNYFWSVEGNSSDQVEIEKLSLYSSKYWFGSPNYGGSNNASHTHTMETGYDKSHPHKEYSKCNSCDYINYTGDTRSVEDCTECIQENCSHEYSDWESTGSSKHKKTCAKCAKEQTASHDWEDIEVTKEATCKEEGSKIQKCSVCKTERTKSISKTNDHSYSDWKYNNDENHSRTCNDCGKTVKEEHEIEEDEDEAAWQTTETEHWQECKVCKAEFHKAEHAFGEDCVAPCEDCEYVRPEGHPFSEEWLTNEENHWRECTACDEVSTEEAHAYSAQCDEDCDICGYLREVEHSYPETMEMDQTSHWFLCEVCGKIESLEDHIPGPEATEENAQNCTACGFELVPQIEHVHDYEPIQSDEQSHWGTCRCGDMFGPELHSWDVSTGKCSICGVNNVVEVEAQNWEFVWYIGAGVMACTIITTISVMIHKGRKRRKAMENDRYWA